MTQSQLILNLVNAGVRIVRSADSWILRHPDGREERNEAVAGAGLESILDEGDSLACVSLSQRGLWFVQRMAPEACLYNYAALHLLSGPLDTDRFSRCVEDLVARHEALRTVFADLDGEAVQVIRARSAESVVFEDLSAVEPGGRRPEAERRSAERRRMPYDLARGPLFRVVVYRCTPEEHYVALPWHHLVMDGMSQTLVWHELAALYAAAAEGRVLPPPKRQYADFAHAQRSLLQGSFLEQELAYWRETLQGPLPALDLPLDRPRPAAQAYEGMGTRPFVISTDAGVALKALAERLGTRQYVAALAAYYVLLYRYTEGEDYVVGFPVAGRMNPPARKTLGYFVNLLPMRMQLNGNQSFLEVLGHAKHAVEGALSHQAVPMDVLVRELNPPRTSRRNALFDAVFAFQKVVLRETSLGGVDVSLLYHGTGVVHADLMAWLEEHEDGYRGWFDYDKDLFEPETIETMARTYVQLIEAVTAEPERAIGTLALSSRLPSVPVQGDTGREAEAFHALVREVAARNPEQMATGIGDCALSYAEMDRQANRIANRLTRQGARAGQIVALAFNPGPERVTAFLGVLKAGCAALMLDASYPPERLAFMVSDSACPFVLTSSTLAAKLPGGSGQLLCLDEEAPALAREPETVPETVAAGSSLAYVVYTSGTSGTPKAVGIEHAGLVHLACWMRDNYRLSPGERVLQFASPSFDAFILEIAWALACAAEIRFADWDTRHSPDLLAALMKRERIAGALVPPAMLRLMSTEGLETLRVLFTGGDVCTPEIAAKWARGRVFVNAYGPSECTVAATAHRCEPTTKTVSVPIGRALGETRLYVLDRAMNPMPAGAPGELVIGGICVGRGYLNRPDLTAERFVTLANGDRVYRTGDRVRMTGDGLVEFMGRLDRQIKVRGFRIEPEEIESVLREYADVCDAAVTTFIDASGERRLAAYVAAPESIAIPELREHLKAHLPAFMVPGGIVRLDAIPISENGKVDWAALPEPAPQDLQKMDSVRPRNAVEEQVAALWEELLGVRGAGVYDHFFDVGGSSLSLVQLLSRVNRQFGVRLSIREAFDHPTIAAIAEAVVRQTSGRTETSGPANTSLVVPLRESGTHPPLFCIPPAGGTFFAYYALSHALSSEQPVYALQDPYFVRNRKPCKTIEEMASYYADAIRTVQPTGRLHLMGWSLGATIAVEVGRQICARGEEAPVIMLLEPSPSHASRRRLGVILQDWYDVVRIGILLFPASLRITRDHAYVLANALRRRVASGNGHVSIRERLSALLTEIAWDGILRQADVAKELEDEARLALISQPNAYEFYRIMRANWAAFRRYRLKPYAGRLIVLNADQSREERMIKRFIADLESVTSGGIERHILSGDHFSLLRRPDVARVARCIEDCIAEKTGTNPS